MLEIFLNTYFYIFLFILFSGWYSIKFININAIRSKFNNLGKCTMLYITQNENLKYLWDSLVEPLFFEQFKVIVAACDSFISGLDDTTKLNINSPEANNNVQPSNHPQEINMELLDEILDEINNSSESNSGEGGVVIDKDYLISDDQENEQINENSEEGADNIQVNDNVEEGADNMQVNDNVEEGADNIQVNDNVEEDVISEQNSMIIEEDNTINEEDNVIDREENIEGFEDSDDEQNDSDNSESNNDSVNDHDDSDDNDSVNDHDNSDGNESEKDEQDIDETNREGTDLLSLTDNNSKTESNREGTDLSVLINSNPKKEKKVVYVRTVKSDSDVKETTKIITETVKKRGRGRPPKKKTD